MSDLEESQRLQEALEWTLAQLQGNVAQFRSTHTDAETVLGIKADFVSLAYLRAYGDHGSDIVGDYICFGVALLRLLDARKRIMELTEAVAMRDSVIKSLCELEEL